VCLLTVCDCVLVLAFGMQWEQQLLAGEENAVECCSLNRLVIYS
jgi:hypothetical protein